MKYYKVYMVSDEERLELQILKLAFNMVLRLKN